MSAFIHLTKEEERAQVALELPAVHLSRQNYPLFRKPHQDEVTPNRHKENHNNAS